MRFDRINPFDFYNGEGIGVSLITQGCGIQPHCKWCNCKWTWDFNKGRLFHKDDMERIKKILSHSWIKRFTITGGEPLSYGNYEVLAHIIKEVKECRPDIKIWLYSRKTPQKLYEEIFTYETGVDTPDSDTYLLYILSHIDVLVNGPNPHRRFLFTFFKNRNKRFLDMCKTIAKMQPVKYK